MDGRGEALIAEADAILRRGGGFLGALFGGGTEKYEDAAEKFNRAGVAFKAVKKWTEAARAYQRAAECYVKAKSEGEAATAYTECARAYVKAGDGRTATEILDREALPRIVESGRLSQAAKLHNEIAEMLEAEGQTAEAIENYQKAADLFVAENATSTAHKALVRVAHLNAQLEPPNYERAAEVFETVGRESLSSSLLKFQAKSHFFHATLCTLARNDTVSARAAFERYKEMDYTFPGTREAKLCEDVIKACTEDNVTEFTNAVYNFDQITKLSPWQTSVLLTIKSTLTGAETGASAGAGGGGGGGGGGASGGAGRAADDDLGVT